MTDDNPDEIEIFDHYIKRERQIIRQKKMDDENRENKTQQPKEVMKCESYI